MSMKEDCQQAIYSYAPAIKQSNASLLGEHSGYVQAVLCTLRDHYYALKEAGETEWSIPDDLKAALDAEKPY